MVRGLWVNIRWTERQNARHDHYDTRSSESRKSPTNERATDIPEEERAATQGMPNYRRSVSVATNELQIPSKVPALQI